MAYLVLLILAGVAVAFIVKGPKHDPRFAGVMYCCKAGLIYLAGCLLIALGSTVGVPVAAAIVKGAGFIAAAAGFAGILVGGKKHVQAMLGPKDYRREVDPKYDVPYKECPHCHKAEVRVSGKSRCPLCGGVFR